MVSSAYTGLRNRLDCSRKPTSDSSTMIGKQPGAGRGVDQGLETMRQQVRHAAGAAIFDVVMHRMGIAARGLERREYRRRHGAARDHKALAEHKILEPALLRHHAMLCGIELGHGWFLRTCG